jgi:hypothetical protein
LVRPHGAHPGRHSVDYLPGPIRGPIATQSMPLVFNFVGLHQTEFERIKHVTVKKLIAELSKLPKGFDVVVCLHPLPPPGFPITPTIETMSSFMFGAAANKEEKLVYVFGCALPRDPVKEPHGKN